MNTANPDARSRRRAFSLIEILIVLTVLGILFAISAPNLFTLMQATSLTSEGNLLRNQLTQAQQLALSKNTDVEIRFFRLADEANAELEKAFRGFQYFQFNAAGQLVPISKFNRIRPPVIISSNFSTLLKTSNNNDTEAQEYGFVSPSSGSYVIPTISEEESTDYVAFRFRPDGSTDLPGRAGSDTWYLTLLQGEGADNAALPANYFTIQIDPFNGRLGVYRP